MIDWRSAHSWLRGFSDAKAGLEESPNNTHDPAAYAKGYSVGRA